MIIIEFKAQTKRLMRSLAAPSLLLGLLLILFRRAIGLTRKFDVRVGVELFHSVGAYGPASL